jgi:hypothetical protein
MKVQYTFPGVISHPKDSVPAGPSEAATFRSRLQKLAGRLPLRWKQVLKLDVPPQGVEWIGAPPRGADFEQKDLIDSRWQWRELLERHAGEYASGHSAQISESVQQMLALLIRYQIVEQELTARHLAEG